jgi:nitronate monooxygenase
VRTLRELVHPIVQAPLAGGPSTVDLAAAVSAAGGLGFVAAGYLTPDALRDQIDATRRLTPRPFGVNVFSPSGAPGDPDAIREFARRLSPLARSAGVQLGEPRFDDDHYAAKLDIVLEGRPAVVSFTFGCPAEPLVRTLHEAGVEVWVTVTNAGEATTAAEVGADVVVAQGAEAGGHRGSFVDDDTEPRPLRALLDDVRAAFADRGDAPSVVATGGIMTGAEIAATIAAGASAAQLGTAFLLCPEAGTNPAQRIAVGREGTTALTRVFTGRRARGIVNSWMEHYDDGAVPRAYPEIHHLTAPLRAHGRAVADADLFNLWAGTGHARARALPAADIVAALAAELDRASRELS